MEVVQVPDLEPVLCPSTARELASSKKPGHFAGLEQRPAYVRGQGPTDTPYDGHF